MIRPRQQSHQVRHHQPDKADHPGRRDRRADTQRRAEHQLALEPFHIDAQVTGLRLPQQQRIQRLGPARQPQRHAHRDQQQRPESRIAGAVQTAQVPECQGAQGRVIGEIGKQTHSRTSQGCQGNARKQHHRHIGLTVAPAQPIHQRRHPQTTDKRTQRQQVRAHHFRQPAKSSPADNRDRRPEGGATGYADQPRIGQRVAKQPLHGYT
ncbi:hypothetical protein PS685_05110 [Pseudomonas fluorescens]|uniref:Uncharacterized protein n=1 Tax=Pseudomonas fluorescens TaxID=294 RepID=A0A5E7A0K3_PSEFL|nr:hypothetical protein PS685_05110 [Pseudomonas fluorescens]